ncbi:competence protein [Streptococcus pseudopneumoniae]|uniref:Competence protein n=1 Tax=Streptococcus pseudopneumoniae TaxID=257758 RepID=A0ABX9PEY0_9STRE|nr:competence protein [Streptococcus pseudopneumoniae]ORC39146.1 competence protein [Streptococcus pseudopneumoniae ATCC BAA-960 = CCUG 49455]NIB75829.1 competence protein [Streptococcus pseudopneumoniae]NIB79721.1 competence protein [Streptococcus pseudopneumoniae]NIB85724.1 competence protein [Streptococcus pseudopneumoniae]
MLEKCKDHLILIDGVEFSCHKFTIFCHQTKTPQHEQGI